MNNWKETTMSRLDYKLRYLLQKRSPEDSGTETEQARVRVLMRFKDELKPIEDLGFETTSVAGDVAAGFATLDALVRIAEHPNVISVESSRPLKRELDTSTIEVNVVSLRQKLDAEGIPCRGEDVIVGVIDSSFDFTHPGFCTSPGDTRILAFWDQRQDAAQMPFPPPPGFNYAPPDGFRYGVEYTKGLIDAALQASDRSRVIPHHRGNHGTRVAGIAAGNGAASPSSSRYMGMAPEADLIFVSYDAEGQLGDSGYAVDAINYIIEKAGEFRKPVVINISQGDSFGPHDGTSLLERAIECHLGQPGIAIVKSAGDEASDSRHASGQVIQGQESHVEFEITADHDEDTFDIWYETRDRFDVCIQLPDGTRTDPVAPESDVTVPLPNGNEAFISSQLNHPDNQDNRINIILGSGAGPTIEHGKWKIILIGSVAGNGSFHIWIDKTDHNATFTQPDRYWTVTIPGTSKRIISVGAYISKGGSQEGDLLLSATSLGPTRDGRMKPDITAPGFDITSAIIEQSGVFYRGEPGASGTSMSAPHVSGVIALLFEKNPTLTQDDIRNVLLENAKTDEFTGVAPNVSWGYGKLDAEAAYMGSSDFNLTQVASTLSLEHLEKGANDMKKQGSKVKQQSAVQEVVIKTTDKDRRNVVNIFLRVSEEGQIAEMFGVSEKGVKWEVKKIKFTLHKKPVEHEDDDNDECKCCTPQGGQIVCVTCPCEE